MDFSIKFKKDFVQTDKNYNIHNKHVSIIKCDANKSEII